MLMHEAYIYVYSSYIFVYPNFRSLTTAFMKANIDFVHNFFILLVQLSKQCTLTTRRTKIQR